MSAAGGWILVPGWGADAEAFDGVVARLPGVAVRIVGWDDLLVRGGAALDEACAALGPGPVQLAGWSLGALLALEAALAAPERFAALALVSGTARFCADGEGHPGTEPRALRAMTARLGRDRPLHSPAPPPPQPRSAPSPAPLRPLPSPAPRGDGGPGTGGAMEVRGQAGRWRSGDRRGGGGPGTSDAVLRAFAAACATPDGGAETAAAWLAQASRFSTEALARGLSALGALDLRARAAALRIPVRLLHGLADGIVPAAAAEALAASLPAARLTVLPGRGHALPIAAPADVAALIAEGR